MDSGKQTEGFSGEGVGERDRLVMGSKEGTYCMVHRVLCANNESWNIASKTGDVGRLGGSVVKRLPSAQRDPGVLGLSPTSGFSAGSLLLPLPLPLLVLPLTGCLSLCRINKIFKLK